MMSVGDAVRRTPGMHDVARRAGVSHQTVSRVLNGHPNVSATTRDRVLQAIAELGYRRNTAARALVTRRSETIGVVAMGTTLFGPASTSLSVEAAAREAGYYVSVASLKPGDADAMRPTFEHFMNQAVEGVVVIAPHIGVAKAVQELAAMMPLVLAADAPKNPAFAVVSVNQRLGARQAVGHLADLGHTDIAHLAGPPEFFDAIARVRGWRQELRRRGLTPGALAYGDWSADSGYDVGRKMLADRVPHAFFVGNDLMALGLIRALTEAGLSVPDDVSVVGFDDIDGSSYFLPPLTTVRQDFSRLGELCIAALFALLDGGSAPVTTPVPTELRVRQSTRAR